MLKLLTPVTLVEIICFLVSLFFLFRDKKSIWKINMIFLILVCITEIFGAYIAKVQHSRNIWLYDIFILFEAAFICCGFYFHLKDFTKARLLAVTGFCMILAVYILEFIKHGFNGYNYITVAVMSVIFVIYSLYYYFLLLKDERYIDLKYHPQFWWVAGVLFYYFGSTMLNLSSEALSIRVISKYPLSYIILIALNILLYSFWSYAFICRSRQRKLLQS